MTLSRRAVIGVLAATPVVTFFGLPAHAMEPQTFQTDGIAINGIDPVGYFTNGDVTPGDMAHSLDYNGAEWLFSSAENLAAFNADPDKYGAQFGGYCAYAASLGYLAPTQPEAWTVYNDRLYLNANLRARELWLKDVPGNIAKGEANWPGILG